MNLIFTSLSLRVLLLLLLMPLLLPAQETEVFARNGYSLTFINNDPALNQEVKRRIISTFFDLYPLLALHYNPLAQTEVVFKIDTAYHSVAEACGGQVLFGAGWLRDHPGDIDVVTHELMHVVQAYPDGTGPRWVAEGIADYVRYTYGVDNKGGGWFLPPYSPEQHYTDGYRITARFLLWLEKEERPGIVKKLDEHMRSKTYSTNSWKELSGKDLDALWESYTRDPII
ncbi:basic secretory family protein [Cesiribacter sp. SM1]|uniref:basic secretory family protein n=1 Tax=Cesiribacter sp. SM1 TaxID=2861196 RepID=UPI001CD76648|nr:basic secretory family protein [Cesiribacter sp. SM1]